MIFAATTFVSDFKVARLEFDAEVKAKAWLPSQKNDWNKFFFVSLFLSAAILAFSLINLRWETFPP